MASSDADPIPIKNAAHRVTFPLKDVNDDLVSGATALDSERSIDGGAFADCSNEAVEIAASSGMYYLDLNASEMNGDTVAIIVKASDAKTKPIVLYPVAGGIKEIYSDTTVIISDLVQIYSDTAQIQQTTWQIQSDTIQMSTDVDNIYSDTSLIHSETTRIFSDTTVITSDTAVIEAAWATALTESYAADGAAFTPAQALYQIWSAIAEFSISGTTITAKKLDGSTTAMTFSIDDASDPTLRQRAT